MMMWLKLNRQTSNVNQISVRLTVAQQFNWHIVSIVAVANKQSLTSLCTLLYDRLVWRKFSTLITNQYQYQTLEQIVWIKYCRLANNKWIKRYWLSIAKHWQTNCTHTTLSNLIDLDVCPEWTGRTHFNHSPEIHSR